MKTEDIITLWEHDSIIDSTELGIESLKIPQLHNKYYKIFIQERKQYFGLENELKRLNKVKHEYYLGVLSDEEMKANEWEPQPLKILRQDIPTYLEADEDLSRLKSRIRIQEAKIEMLESIIKAIVNRGFLIKNSIEWAKFQQGL